MGTQPDYSRAALARFIEFVVEKGLVHPATAQGWRVATTKVLEELPPAELADVRRIEVETTFRSFLNRYPGRLPRRPWVSIAGGSDGPSRNSAVGRGSG